MAVRCIVGARNVSAALCTNGRFHAQADMGMKYSLAGDDCGENRPRSILIHRAIRIGIGVNELEIFVNKALTPEMFTRADLGRNDTCDAISRWHGCEFPLCTDS